ncbi:MAG: hypothetical protein ABSH41_28155 [Syntrophobacteraceae bacterium]
MEAKALFGKIPESDWICLLRRSTGAQALDLGQKAIPGFDS